MSSLRLITAVVSGALIATLTTGTANAAVARHYRAISIGNLGGGFSIAHGMNDHGEVVGMSSTAGSTHPFLWRRGMIHDLGVPTPGSSGEALAVNNHDQVAGDVTSLDASNRYITHAVLWDHGKICDLGGFGGIYSAAVSVNDRGQVTGVAETASGEFHGFRWDNGVLTDLGEGRPIGINNRGEIAGTHNVGPYTEAYRWVRGRFTNLGGLGDRPFSQATGINNHGHVVGLTNLAGIVYTHAFLTRGDKMADLGTLNGTDSVAYAINDRDQVIGESDGHPFLWQRGKMINLVMYGVNDGPVVAINNRGDVLGNDNQGHPTLYV